MKTYKMIISALAIVLSLGIMSGCGETAGEKKADDTTTTTTTAAQTETTTTTAAVEETPEQTEIEAAKTPENTETESTPETTAPAEQPEGTGIVTYADNPDGKYTLMECFRRKAEEYSGQKVVSMGYNSENMVYELTLSDGRKSFLTAPMKFINEPDNLYSIDLFEILEMEVNEYSFVVST